MKSSAEDLPLPKFECEAAGRSLRRHVPPCSRTGNESLLFCFLALCSFPHRTTSFGARLGGRRSVEPATSCAVGSRKFKPRKFKARRSKPGVATCPRPERGKARATSSKSRGAGPTLPDGRAKTDCTATITYHYIHTNEVAMVWYGMWHMLYGMWYMAR